MNYFKGLKKVLDQYGILLVSDEIQMGFYRTGKLWSIEHFGVTPDVIVFGKALTNGLNPLSGLWAREELINPEVFPPGSTHSTFNANPLGTAVGLEAMKMMHETDYEAMVMAKGAHFLEGLQGPAEAPQGNRRRRRPGPGAARGDLHRGRLHAEQGAGRPHGRHRPGRRPGAQRQEDRPGAGHRRLLQERDHPGALAAHQPPRRSTWASRCWTSC